MGTKWVQNTAIESWVYEVAEKAENGIAQRHRWLKLNGFNQAVLLMRICNGGEGELLGL